MLVLSRGLGERIIVGGNIIIEVLGLDPKKVKLGIEAPTSVQILRSEAVKEKPPIPADAACDVRTK